MFKNRFNWRNVVKIVTILTAVTMFSGCNKKDDDPSNNDTTSIVGVWVFEKGTVKELAFKSGIPQPLQNEIKDGLLEWYDEDFAGSIWDFQSSGKIFTVFADGSDPDDESTYSVNGDILTGTDPDGFFMTGQYSITGNKLYWDVDVLASPDTEELVEMGVTKAIMRLMFNKKDNSSSSSGQWKIKASEEYISYHAWMVEMGAPSALDADGYFKQTFKSEQEALKWIDDKFKPYCRPVGGGITECSDYNLDELYEAGKIGTPVKMP